MAFALRLLFLLCGIGGLVTGAWSLSMVHWKVNNCPNGWTELNCNCYIYQREERTFSDAESVCNILGGNLVSLHNPLENAFVLELARAGDNDDQFWIGYSDVVEADTFIWTDGSAQDFTNYDPNATPAEPNPATGDCIELFETDGFWLTVDCTNENAYVCIREVYRG
ncbi:lactose-binding lectin l-2-like [Phyllopteryx taeniolatus]|uniref:lactose-binding lectin l-2-like n=1 Tax=Phyllopteryx taeniolatus TaxID=161469 RepID=UPI002AD48CC5|nr:lactose-binding lectin l-2-like [Phyllopteryx taeniolatus]XP_061630868.1 lactose-binding lectin l-2-like [Phyllopteryx taeniolatus]XP_061630869.1 lactose-binding lectin l-2-like [Phyllopteryx taeniolatus]